MKIVKFSTFNKDPRVEFYLKRLTPGSSGIWRDYQFIFDDSLDDCDYWVVFETLPEPKSIRCHKANTVFLAGEGSSIRTYNRRFLRQFGHVITCQRNLKHSSIHYKSPGHGWFPLKSYDELVNKTQIGKDKLMSIVVSNKKSTLGHRKRLEFCLKLKEVFGDKVDLFGRGFNEFEDKWEVLAPYKYSVAIENSIEDDWITEKIGDCFIAHTFPFYVGAGNLSDYYNSNSYERIDLQDFRKSVDIISRVIYDPNHYSNHLDYILESKYVFLNEHGMFPMLAKFLDGIKVEPTKATRFIRLQSEDAYRIFPGSTKVFRLLKKIAKTIMRKQ